MRIRVQCPSCERSFQVDIKYLGKRAKCPKCGQAFRIQDSGSIWYDAFISYASQDRATADLVCSILEKEGLRCWIAPRDILPGAEYGASIVAAIHRSRSLVLVFSGHANRSPQVRREVERAASKDIPIVPLRIENVTPSEAMEFFISSHHWTDALKAPLEPYICQLAAKLHQMLFMPAKNSGDSPSQVADVSNRPTPSAITATQDGSEPQLAAAGPHKQGRRLAFIMGFQGLFLIFLKGTIRCSTFPDEAERQAWPIFNDACNQLNVKSGLQDYL